MESAKGWAGTIRFSDSLRSQFHAFYARHDTFSLGICNGCQLMALLGWVPGTGELGPLPDIVQPRFVHNSSGRCPFPEYVTQSNVQAEAAPWEHCQALLFDLADDVLCRRYYLRFGAVLLRMLQVREPVGNCYNSGGHASGDVEGHGG